MAVDTKTMKAPIHANCFPAVFEIAPTGPKRVDLPIANSAIINGTDQIKRKITQGIKNEPPPFCATILENRQIFPVPTAMPIVAIINAQREEKNSFEDESFGFINQPLVYEWGLK